MTRCRAQLILVGGILAGLGSASSFVACLPAYTFGSDALADASGDAVSVTEGDGSAVPDGTVAPGADSSSPIDGSKDGGPRDAAPSQNDGSLAPTSVVSAGKAAFATGFGDTGSERGSDDLGLPRHRPAVELCVREIAPKRNVARATCGAEETCPPEHHNQRDAGTAADRSIRSLKPAPVWAQLRRSPLPERPILSQWDRSSLVRRV